MTYKAKIFGAGSIGNHLTNACRLAGFEVTMVDSDPGALRRMKEEIYPKRYGAWDEGIQQFLPQDAPKGGFDVVLVGTPPDVHLRVATSVLRDEAPKVLQIEKPLCSPTLEGLDEFLGEVRRHPESAVVVGYNHLLAENTAKTEEIIRLGTLGKPQAMDCEFRSHWKNIFDAHPWLSGPKDTYLGFWRRGGGAGGEHSHGLNLWQHMAHTVGAGRVAEVGAIFDFVESDGASYDRSCFLNLATERGLVGRVVHDVITLPKKKFLQLQCEKGSVGWHNDVTKTSDQVIVQEQGKDKQVLDIQKTRVEEFSREIEHIRGIIEGRVNAADSPIRLARAVDTMCVLAAAVQSHREKRVVTVRYAAL